MLLLILNDQVYRHACCNSFTVELQILNDISYHLQYFQVHSSAKTGWCTSSFMMIKVLRSLLSLIFFFLDHAFLTKSQSRRTTSCVCLIWLSRENPSSVSCMQHIILFFGVPRRNQHWGYLGGSIIQAFEEIRLADPSFGHLKRFVWLIHCSGAFRNLERFAWRIRHSAISRDSLGGSII